MKSHQAWALVLALFACGVGKPSDIPIAITNNSGKEVVAIEVDAENDSGAYNRTFYFDGLATGASKTVQVQGFGDMNCALLVRFAHDDLIHGGWRYVSPYSDGLRMTIHEDWVEDRTYKDAPRCQRPVGSRFPPEVGR